MHKLSKYYKGATLIELIIVMTIMGILSAGAVILLRLTVESHNLSQSLIDQDWQGQLALTMIKKDLHNIRNTSAITSAQSNSITFKDLLGNTITYQLTGTNLMRNSNILASNIHSLQFTYYRSNGNTTSNTSLIRYIAVSFQLGITPSYDFTTGVALWNLL